VNVRFAPTAIADLARLRRFLQNADSAAAAAAVRHIKEAARSLHDFSSRGVKVQGSPTRRLLVSFGHSGYLIDYAIRSRQAEVLILRIRHSREAR
jgi:toxin ParE1/3/4